MNPPSIHQIRLFSSDLDGTLVGTPEATHRFKIAWEALPEPTRPLLVYNSGRLTDDIAHFVSDGTLPEAQYYIGGVGTQIYDVREGCLLAEFHKYLAQGWDRAAIHALVSGFPGITPQAPEFQHELKSSWFMHGASAASLRQLRTELKRAGIHANLVYSSGRDLDLIPLNATKAGALAWLCEHLGISYDEVLVAGDSGNDSNMFRLPGVKGIIVENAQPELFEATVDVPVYSAKGIIADGVLDGLHHYKVLASVPKKSEPNVVGVEMPDSFKLLFSGSSMASLSDDERQFLLLAYDKALEALKKNITPLGFTACSLKDNTVTGTDENYRSIWARDGSITVWCTLQIDDPEIRRAQVATFETLLAATTPNGLVPANVRINDGRPDYSGVGNIASIDSGLWLIIALYNFAAHTGDYSLLYTHAERLQTIMNWLEAHDSNNDGLLEIPEASDWTDLFGRSYNVLYDEVLWFRANVCFGRIQEFMGSFEKAASYLRASQKIKGKLLDTFWPGTEALAGTEAKRPHRFSDRQFSLGDTQYLLAEITPFSFNWRCDVFGNVLAFLMNVLDVNRARTAFRFMWGVGVNQPWPVANLYPVVQSGDPDWKAYYTVNLLNLPHHYHNGGIWPLVGGLWVRFIQRLGFHDVACSELVRLARLNQQGRDKEWEFNEWAQGQTGRPMGKAFQAWSAASFLRACHEVGANPEYSSDTHMTSSLS